MPAVLTTASILQCPHLGPFSVQASQRLITVDGAAVVTENDVRNAPIATCPVNLCTKVQTVETGVAASLTLGGGHAVLASAGGATDTTPGWSVLSAGQAKLEAT